MLKRIIFCVVLLFIVLTFPIYIKANNDDTIVQLGNQIKEVQRLLDESKKASKPLEETLAKIEKDFRQIENNIASLELQIREKEKEIDIGERELLAQKKAIELRIRSYYKQSRSYFSNVVGLLLRNGFSEGTRLYFYEQQGVGNDRAAILKTTFFITTLEEKKAELLSQKKKLAVYKADLAKQKAFYDVEVGKARKYQGELEGKIAELSAKQQQIINSRSGSFTVNIGDSELADDYNASLKGFRESAPGGYFGVFSFGAYTHRNGMSQYGALGRVKNSNWNYEQLLKHYYPGIELKKVDNPSIVVNGTNSYGQVFNNESFSLEDYLKHIYEVPPSWPVEILKAQAIAARSYAYGKSSICPGQQCQEFKREENADSWKQAVKDTEGTVMSGGPGSYQYSSTTGGWVNGGVRWDTTDGGGGSGFLDKSYEKIAGSPWVYKAWYTETYRNDSDKCGRSNAWVSPQEMADIVNAAFVMNRSGSGADTGRVTPPSPCWGGNPYSTDELRNVSEGYGGGVNSVSGVSVGQGEGTTNEVIFQTDKGEKRLGGAEFKKGFNLRAPGRLSIPQSGFAFFNIEKK